MTTEEFKGLVNGMNKEGRWSSAFEKVQWKLTNSERVLRGHLLREVKAVSPDYVGLTALSLYDLEDVKRSQYKLQIARLRSHV